MGPRPVIGIPADRRMLGLHPFHVVGEKYITALLGGGMLPLLVPSLGEELAADELLGALDGLLLTGSPSNVEPHHYRGEPSAPGTLHDPARDATTLPLIPRAMAAGVPVLGICRGFQELNVALGGTLWQKVHEQPGLAVHHEDLSQPLEVQYGPAHDVTLADGGVLRALNGGAARLVVNSLHHQGIRDLAPVARIEATAPDGLIEAFSVPTAKAFTLAVQWHPEWKPQDNAFSRALFEEFGRVARLRAVARKQGDS
jgi:putative glutamine amidotransferase